jgi:O-antigen/teichoic acid export membrane protein
MRLTGKKKFIGDVGLNILASLIMTGVLQLVIYPFFGREMPGEAYGTLQLMMGIANMFGTVFGGSINNVRLVRQLEYDKAGVTGDFNPLFLISLALNVTGTFAMISIVEPAYGLAGKLAVCLISLLVTFRIYYMVEYRIHLNFKRILLMNLVYVGGGLAGLWLSRRTGSWQISFITAEVAAFCFLMATTRLYKERYRFTGKLRGTAQLFAVLAVVALLNNAIVYLDRLLLYPLFGGNDVAVYTTASFFGKSLALVMAPVAGVLLSYYAKRERLSARLFGIQAVLVSAACAVFFFVSASGMGRWATGLLYPTLIDQALPYLALANLAAIIKVGSEMLLPSILKFCHMAWQIVIYGIHLALYLALGIAFAKNGGLLWFCHAALIANAIKYIMVVMIGAFVFRRQEKRLSHTNAI